MPIFEAACDKSLCALYGHPIEHYYPRSDSPMHACESCGGETRKLVSRFGIVFTGLITRKYIDTKLEDGNRADGGHWVWDKKSTVDGKPKARYITTWQEQKEHCAREGLAVPSDQPSNLEVSADGTKISSQGMPGAWY